jgi:predicted transposase/invertase (TIGR01784 family)
MKNVTLIMISNYDPFGYDRMLYTIERRCVEEPDMLYNDGSKTLYLYAYGKKDIPSQELADMLKYMADSTKENVVNSNLEDIQGMMDDIKMDSGKGVRYMQSWEIEDICFEQGHASGLAEGKAEIILNMKKNGFSAEQIAKATNEDIEKITAILEKREPALV